MDIKVLKSFVAVATHCSFSKAAKELHTVQPAISRHIINLENELGVSLFFRTSREVTITAAGERLLKDAINLIEQTEKTKQAVIQASYGLTGNLTIGYLAGATLGFLPDLVRKYFTVHPNIDVDLVELTASEQLEALENRTIDISFSRPLPVSMAQDYSSTVLYLDKLVVIVPVTHSLANLPYLSLSALCDEDFILFQRSQAVGLFDSIISQCSLAGFSPTIKKQPNQMQTVLTHIASGLGISIAPSSIKDLRTDGCKFIPLKDVNINMPLVMTHQLKTLSPTAKSFAQLVVQHQDFIEQAML